MPKNNNKKVKAKAQKIFKVKRANIKDDKNNFVIRFKGDWSVQQIRDFRMDLDYFCQEYLSERNAVTPEEKQESVQ